MTEPAASPEPADLAEPTELVHRHDLDGVATLTLDSPANRNALSAALVDGLDAHLEACGADPAVRAIVLTHTGTTFCSGADLAETAREGGPATGTLRLVGLLRRILEVPRPVVARVDGHVRAGGIGIIGACDVVVAARPSSFAFTEVRLGLAPAIISLTVRPRLDDRAASATWLTGDRFDATEAARIGLITTASDALDDDVAAVLASFAQASPQGLAATKELLNTPVLAAFDRDADALVERSSELFASEEAQEGIAAFRERRPPRWAR